MSKRTRFIQEDDQEPKNSGENTGGIAETKEETTTKKLLCRVVLIAKNYVVVMEPNGSNRTIPMTDENKDCQIGDRINLEVPSGGGNHGS